MGSSSSSIWMVVLLTVITVTFISRYCYRQYKKHQRHLDHGERTNLHVVLSDIRYTSGNLLESSISLVSVVAKKSSDTVVGCFSNVIEPAKKLMDNVRQSSRQYFRQKKRQKKQKEETILGGRPGFTPIFLNVTDEASQNLYI